MEQTSRTRLVAGLIVLVALAGLAVLSVVVVSPPKVIPADAPATEFSAERAYRHVERIGSQKHVTGSPAAADVREYIVSSLTQIGLQPQIHTGVGADGALSGPFGMAPVRNVVAVLPGTASTGRIFMFAHYDSVQVSYGANDDGAGVSTLLETARALTAGPPPVNDIVFLFTDAEEACLCGSEAFVSQDPLAAQGGVALNFESRGASGPAIMFETSAGNSDVVGVYGDAVPYPVATSVAVEVYRILPNDTDFTPFRESGRFTGLNTAYIDGSAIYHAPEDRPSYMDISSLQHHGSNALALAQAFGAANIAELAMPSAADSTYFPALGVLLRYPGWLVWPFAAFAVLGVLALGYLARRRGLTGWPRLAAGFGLATVPLLLAPVAAQLLWLLLETIRPGYANMEDPWQPGWYRACVVAIVAAILLTWYGLLRRRVGPWPLAIGALGWLAVLGVVLAVVAPGGSYLTALPAVAGAVGGLIAVSVRRPLARLAANALSAAVAVLILAPTVYLFFPALGLQTGAAAALFAVLLGMAILPVVEQVFPKAPAKETADGQEVSRHRLWAAAPALIAGVLAATFLATGLVVDQFDAEHPAPVQLAYALDADTGQARWVSRDAELGDWISQYVTGREDINGAFGVLDSHDLATGAAQPAPIPAPLLTVVADTVTGDQRELTVSITPQRDARLVYFDLPAGGVLGATVAGREVPTEELNQQLRVVFHGPPADGVQVVLKLASTGPAQIRVMDGSDGLDGLPGYSPPPPGIGASGSHYSDLLLVAKTYTA